MQSMACVNATSLIQSFVQLEEQLVPVDYIFILRTFSFSVKVAKRLLVP